MKIGKGQLLLNIEYTARFINRNSADEDTTYQQGKLAQYKLEAIDAGATPQEIYEAESRN
jgi:hypothetical protein